jgi:predicted amino acid racemase
MLLRVPALTELPDLVRLCDASLQSELTTLEALEAECARQGRNHKVIVMADLGDLREGFWDKDALIDACLRVERDMPRLHLQGIGVNLGCVGSVQPTPEKMQDLLALARRVEAAIGRRLETISGGATSSYTLVHWGTMPEGINHLRIGENILLGKDLQVDWGIRDMDYLAMDTFTLTAQVIEVKTKPSYPQGQLCIDAFGHKPSYTDYGIQRRVLLALGRADAGEVESLIPREEGVTVWGASSDHCILDVTHSPREFRVGDTVDFSLSYVNLLYASARSDVRVVFEE